MLYPSPPSPNAFDPFEVENARTLIGLCAAFSLLATASVAARFYSRAVKGVKPELSDWLVVGSLFFYFTFVAQEILCVKIGGLGHHIWEIPEEFAIRLAKISVFCQFSYILSMGLVRWSICSLLRRIFWTTTFRKTALGIIVFNALWMLWGILSIALRCLPFSYAWRNPMGHNCAGEMPMLAVTATWGLVTELIIWSTPIPMVWNLNTPRSNKIALTAIFAFGFLDIIVGIIRLVTVIIIDFNDASYSETSAVYWIIIEPSISIMVVSLPLCRPLFDKLVPFQLIRRLQPCPRTTKTSDIYGDAPEGHGEDQLGLYPTAHFPSDLLGHAGSRNVTPKSSDSLQDQNSPPQFQGGTHVLRSGSDGRVEIV